MKPKSEEIKYRKTMKPLQEGVIYRCPCCTYKTLSERGGDEICPICFWQDDEQGDENANEVWGGPNSSLSLSQARINFQSFGAVEERYIRNVRKPFPEEFPSTN